MPDIPGEELPFYFDISKVGNEWWLEVPWTIVVCNSRESAEEELDKQVRMYNAKLAAIGNPTSAAELIVNHGEYATAVSPPRLTDESGKELPWT
jgi:hypothetical protein